ncbi:MAG: 23S rRNA (adenine(2503)-C(2))-methyltransferase RlmN [Deltaproteobacteria bacterium]|jgi:23S rRNA (adenine2503-C2)-methyltransferase|nr:23S rRNA (adenine(2503)-C(2))-methyltransferase RlmN [Deltaproteobacteria bacterium]
MSAQTQTPSFNRPDGLGQGRDFESRPKARDRQGSITQGDRLRLKDLSPAEITQRLLAIGEKKHRGAQISKWLFQKGANSFDEMTDVSKPSRAKFAELFSVEPLLAPVHDQAEPSGARRLLWKLQDDLFVDSVIIKANNSDHLTLCVSTQVGCRMGCRFCRTGTLGLKRNLTPGEIIGQLIWAKKLTPKNGPKITNVVFMGMGEPLDNPQNVLRALDVMTSPDYQALPMRGVTLSTVGAIPQLREIIDSGRLKARLTISLGSAVEETRSRLMPANLKWPLFELKEVLRDFQRLQPSNRITFSLVLLSGVNDSLDQAKQLSKFLTGLKSKVNLIPFNPWPGAPFDRPSPQSIESFQNFLLDKHHTVQIRDTKGASINAACGLLVGERVS